MLLTILLLHTGGLLLIYKIQQWNSHYTMSQTVRLKQSGFQRLTVSVSEFQNSKLNRNEIFFRGNMYDIKSVTLHGNSAELFVVNDINEKCILQKVKYLLQSTKNRQDQLPGQIVQLLMHSYIFQIKETKLFLPGLPENIYPRFSKIPVSFVCKITSPPPELV
jgi:hypothetical protein